jgi:hypothetical protein
MRVNAALRHIRANNARRWCRRLSSGVPLSSSDEKCCHRFCQGRRCRSPGWTSSLVDGSRRGAVASEIMAMQNLLTKDTSPPAARVVIVMGVSGCGKSTVGALLASRLRWEFEDADWFHPAANVDKMRRGIPLTDEDRWPWLAAVAAWIDKTRRSGAQSWRRSYRAGLSRNHTWRVN